MVRSDWVVGCGAWEALREPQAKRRVVVPARRAFWLARAGIQTGAVSVARGRRIEQGRRYGVLTTTADMVLDPGFRRGDGKMLEGSANNVFGAHS